MTPIDWLGIVAAILTTGAFIPQTLQTLKTRSTDDISLLMYIGFVSGISLWLIYGLIIENWPIILGNGVTLFFAGIILTIKIKIYLRRKEKVYSIYSAALIMVDKI